MSNRWSRRAFVSGAFAAACAPKAAPDSPTSQATRLGYRFYPGQVMTHEVLIVHRKNTSVIRRKELWTYTVDALDASGLASLRGWLEGVGVDNRGAVSSSYPNETTPREVRLTLNLTGQLQDLDAKGLAHRLPHELLALSLPNRVIRPGTRWNDPELCRPYASLVPPPSRPQLRGTTKYVEPEGTLLRLEQKGEITAGPKSPVLHLAGEILWDPLQGRLEERSLDLWLTPDASSSLRASLKALT